MTGKPATAAPNTLRAAIRLGLLRVVGEQRYRDRVEELDRMADAVLVEVKRHQHNRSRELPFDVDAQRAQLLHLVDRAASGRLLPAEERLLRDGITRLAREAGRG
jgi:hypothetical protein